jgi:hypothetical protein
MLPRPKNRKIKGLGAIGEPARWLMTVKSEAFSNQVELSSGQARTAEMK